MKKISLAVLIIAGVMAASDAEANQGYFGGRPSLDGSINMRASTTEQFDPIRGQSVAQRPRPDFDPTPIDVSSFQLFPSLTAGGYYDSNIYSTQTGEKDDVVWKMVPALAAVSNWGRHAVAFTGFADINRYTNNSTEDYDGGAAQLEGRYDVAPSTWLGAKGGYQRVTEPRGSPNVLGAAAEPTQYDLYNAGAEGYRGMGKLKAKVDYDWSLYDFDPVAVFPAGTASQNNRNRIYNSVSTEVSYEVSENLKPFIRGGYDWRDYTSNFTRNSHGYNVDIGAFADFGGIVTGEAYAGYRARDMYNFADTAEIPDFGGKVLWNVTELTSVEGEASRSIDETTVGGSSTIVSSGGSVTVTHELRRNIILEGNGSYTHYDYRLVPREDVLYGAGVGGRYYISRNLYADATFDYSKRETNQPGADYDRHVTYLRVGVQY
jgi:hypothetical protein